MLVHFNNIINAVNLGVSTGLAVRVWLSTGFAGQSLKETQAQMAAGVESVLLAFFMSLIAPLLYHTLLIVGFCFAQPLSNDHTRLPVERFLQNLEKDLHASAVLAEYPASWQKPVFRKPA